MAREPVNHPRQRGESDSKKSFLKRRDYLRLSATATAVGTVSSAAVSGSAVAESPADTEFNQRLNAVDDLGLDPTGGEPINDALSRDVAADTLIEFPAGEYLVTDELSTDVTKRFGITETDSSDGDVSFVIEPENENPIDSMETVVLSEEETPDLSLDEANQQQSVDPRSGSTLLVFREDSFEMHDVQFADFDSDMTAKDSEPKTLTIVGPNEGVANYRLTVSDSIDSHAEEGTQQTKGLPSTSVEDALGDSTHSYAYTGDLASFHLSGEATVYVDGQEVDPTQLAEGSQSLPNLLVFDARDEDEHSYELSIDGDAPRDADETRSLQSRLTTQ